MYINIANIHPKSKGVICKMICQNKVDFPKIPDNGQAVENNF